MWLMFVIAIAVFYVKYGYIFTKQWMEMRPQVASSVVWKDVADMCDIGWIVVSMCGCAQCHN